VLWNMVYLERAAHALRGDLHAVDDVLLQYLSSLGCGGTSTCPAITCGLATPSEVQAPTAAATSLAYDFPRFLRRPYER